MKKFWIKSEKIPPALPFLLVAVGIVYNWVTALVLGVVIIAAYNIALWVLARRNKK